MRWQERKYFDSGDYALSKAGKASDTGVTTIGTEHPTAESIPHTSPLTNSISRHDSISGASGAPSLATSPDSQPMLPGAGIHRGSINGIPGGGLPGATTSRSPVKESSFLARTASADDEDDSEMNSTENTMDGSISPPPKKDGIPIRS